MIENVTLDSGLELPPAVVLKQVAPTESQNTLNPTKSSSLMTF